MDKLSFLQLEENTRCHILASMASEAVSVLSEYKNVFEVASEAVELLKSHLVNPLPPKQIGLFLEHYDESKDISSLYDHVQHDNLAISAVDVIAYATGAIALATYQSHGIRSATDPILEATPEVFEFALSQYRKLEKAKLAKAISEVWAENSTT